MGWLRAAVVTQEETDFRAHGTWGADPPPPSRRAHGPSFPISCRRACPFLLSLSFSLFKINFTVCVMLEIANIDSVVIALPTA